MSQKSVENKLQLIVTVIVLLVAGFFTYFGFIHQPGECNPIDKEFLYCHLHPMGALSIIGAVLFYSGAALLAGVTRIFTNDLRGPWGVAAVAAIVIGFILIYAS